MGEMQGILNSVFDESNGALRVTGDTLTAGDPSEVDIDSSGGVTTITLTDEIQRRLFDYKNTQYYMSNPGASTGQSMTLNRMQLAAVPLRAGTIDRLGIEVSTAAATAIARVGIYADNNNTPDALIAEATSGADTYPFDCSTTGAKNGAISAVIPTNGIYWMAVVNQTAAISIQGGASFSWIPLQEGTSPGSGAAGRLAMFKTSVTGALPNPCAPGNGSDGSRLRFQFRYSA